MSTHIVKIQLSTDKLGSDATTHVSMYAFSPPQRVYTLLRIHCGRTTVQTFTFLHQSTVRLPVPGCKTPVNNMSKNKSNTATTLVSWESKLWSDVRSSMHPCPGNWVAIGRAVVYYARVAHALSAGIKC